MKSKLISFPYGYFERKKQSPLTSSMINTLLDACEKQHKGIPFGPNDIKGSIAALITRGLIINKEVSMNQNHETLWQVTNEAIEMLRTMGIKISC